MIEYFWSKVEEKKKSKTNKKGQRKSKNKPKMQPPVSVAIPPTGRLDAASQARLKVAGSREASYKRRDLSLRWSTNALK